MCVEVQRVSNMPYSTEIWVIDDSPSQFTVLIDKELITEWGAALLGYALDRHLGARRLDASTVRTTLHAITG
jgi:hypothetical protein